MVKWLLDVHVLFAFMIWLVGHDMMGHEMVNGISLVIRYMIRQTGDDDLFGIYTYIPMQDRINFIYIFKMESHVLSQSRHLENYLWKPWTVVLRGGSE